MYCTTKLFLSMEQAGGSVMDCLPFLTNLSEIYKQNTGQTYLAGHAGNLRVGVSEYGINIEGSLAKFYLGTNLHSLNRSDSRRAFEMMADTLHLPIQRATVSRVDIGVNLMTDYKPELYYPYLGPSSKYERFMQPKSIRYENSMRRKKFYNKIAESKKYNVAIPDVYKDKNLLRYELCYMQRLPKQFNQPVITPDVLTNERFYMEMYDRWFKEYEVIQKVGVAKMDTTKIKTEKDFLDQLLILSIQEKGLDAVLHQIDVLKEQKVYKHPEYYSHLKKKVRKIISSTKHVETPELLEELNRKVARAKENYR
ncbi:phage/plasmid replication protein [Pontibacter toksunensis]|uniref:Phage/plasmid replication protein n=1 Tax=Pontibacter toksunensis TaxID=1332631 RepID=A0ABW6BUI5_9BACT